MKRGEGREEREDGKEAEDEAEEGNCRGRW